MVPRRPRNEPRMRKRLVEAICIGTPRLENIKGLVQGIARTAAAPLGQHVGCPEGMRDPDGSKAPIMLGGRNQRLDLVRLERGAKAKRQTTLFFAGGKTVRWQKDQENEVAEEMQRAVPPGIMIRIS